MTKLGALWLHMALPISALAQTAEARRSFYLAVDNDLIAVRGIGLPPDRDYTHGTRLGLVRAGAPAWIRRRLGAKQLCRSDGQPTPRTTTRLELGQEIYTPRHDSVLPVPGERPYAGWLYVAAGAQLACPSHTRALGIAVGVTGPPSLAAHVQNALHRLLGNEPQLGWAHQVRFEPGLVLRYEESRIRDYAIAKAAASRLSVRWGATAGNVRTAVHVAANVRIGLRKRMPWAAAESDIWKPMHTYVIADYQRDLVFRDLTVDGNTFGARTQVRRRILAGQYEAGVGFRGRSYSFEYHHTSRDREYQAQPGPHSFGTVVVRVHGF